VKKVFPFIRALLILGRVSNLPTVWTNVLAGWFLAGGSWTGELAWLLAGVSLLYVGGMTLNDACDAKWDREFAPGRPIPSGRISERTVWIIAVLQMLGGSAIWWTQTSVHPWLQIALPLAIVGYDLIHKRWAGAVLLMGLCRGLVYAGAASAVVAQTADLVVPGTVLALAVGVLLYIAGLTFVARSEHLAKRKALPLWPRLLLMLPVLFPLVVSRIAPDPMLRGGLIVIGIAGIWAWLVIVRTQLRVAVGRGIGSAIAGIALYDAAAVAFADWPAAVVSLGCFGLALAAQRIIPAT
jgi:4-hydroxybenzoate polyprenyltransferase